MVVLVYLQSAKDALQTFELTVPGVVWTEPPVRTYDIIYLRCHVGLAGKMPGICGGN
jgi:hypothetical protein